MDYIYIGKIVNTHGIKGELRIISDMEYKDCIFVQGNHLYIGKNKRQETIVTYRTHKTYDMVTFEGLRDINDVLIYKGESVYIKRDEILFPGVLKQDLIGMDVIAGKYRGKVVSILKSKAHDILVVEEDNHRYLVPYIDAFLENIDVKNHSILVKDMKGLFDED